VQYIQEAAPRGLVTLDFNQNGDYFISDAVSHAGGSPYIQHMLYLWVSKRQGRDDARRPEVF
jgi:hypothetical protein